jgi:RHS repeat-associated protein
LISPPTANNNGTANLSFPIEIPAGRQGLQPSLSINYNSSGDMGLFGLGWDMNIPNITIETRWGVPHYDLNKESETYLLNGEQLLRMDDSTYNSIHALTHRAAWENRDTSGYTYFCTRTEGSFNRIIRHGTTPKNYWWEVIDKKGLKYFYGKNFGNDNNNIYFYSVLNDFEGNIGKWNLTEIRDLNGNYVRYTYNKDIDFSGTAIYPSKIDYTGKENYAASLYSILFDTISLPTNIYNKSNGRLGFLEKNNKVISGIKIQYNSQVIKQDRFCYVAGGFGKLLLKNISEVKPAHFGDTATSCFCTNNDTTLIKIQEFEYFGMPSATFGNVDIIEDQFESAFSSVAPISPSTILGSGKIGGSSDFGWSIGAAATIGFGIGVAWNKLITAGGNYMFSQNRSKGLKTLIDIDGDGLPDRVFRFSDQLYYQKQVFDSQQNAYYFALPVELFGTSKNSFQEEITNSNDFGWEVQIGATAAGNYSTSKSKTNIYFSDINADGLPDIVDGGYVYYNILNASGVPVFSVIPPTDTTTQNFAGGFCIDAGMGSDSGSGGIGNIISSNEIDSEILYREGRIIENRRCINEAQLRYMGIINNDIYIFLDSLINLGYYIDSTQNGLRTFCWTKYDTIPPEKEIYPPHDLVKIWKAPYTGQIKINSDIILTDNLMDNRDETDSLLVSIQLHNAIIFLEKLHKNHVQTTVNLSNLNITKGDNIYFRVESMDKKRYDKVFWQPEITYTQYNTTFLSSEQQELVDANGQKIYKFNSSEDFLINPKMQYEMPFNGIIKIESQRIISEDLSDNVNFTIKRNSITEFSDYHRDIVNDEINVDYIEVNQGDTIVFEVECSGNVKWQAIKWIPILYYDNIYATIIDGDTINIDAYNTMFNPPIPNIKFDIIPRYQTYPKPIRPTEILAGNSYSTDTLKITASQNFNGTLSVKGSDNSVQNININFSANQSGNVFPISPGITFTNNISYFLDLYINTQTTLNSIGINFSSSGGSWDNVHYVGIHCLQDSSDLRFGDMYQNWGQFNYLNTSGDYTDIIVPDSLNLSIGLQNTINAVQAQIASNPTDSATLANANATVTNWFSNHPYEEEKFLMLDADYLNNQWVGYGNISYINSDTLSNTYPCILSNANATNYSGDLPVGQIQEDANEIPANLPAGAKKTAPIKRSETKNKILGITVPLGDIVGVGGTGMAGDIRTISDFQDMNGDRYPDEISEYEIKYSQPQGGWSDYIVEHIQNDAFGNIIKSESYKYTGSSANFGASFQMAPEKKTFTTIEKGKTKATSQVDNGSGGLSGSTNRSDSKIQWIDINGDGLPDKIFSNNFSNNYVFLNLGYQYSNPKVFSGDTKIDKSVTFGASVGMGNSNYSGDFTIDAAGELDQFNGFGTSISGGFGANYTTNNTTDNFIDINGDGLPDLVSRNGIFDIDNLVQNNNSLNIRYNRGGTNLNFSNPTLLIPAADIFRNTKLSSNVNVSVTIGFCVWYLKFAINPKANLSWGVGRSESMFTDMNADGLPDYVYEENHEIKVRYNQLGKVNLLKSVKNIANGKFSVDYKLSENNFDCPNRTMTMSELKVFDGYQGDGIDTLYFTFAYDSARYDRFNRENLGFKTVTTKQLNENATVYRITTEKYHNSEYPTKGLKYNELITAANGTKYIEKNYIYRMFALTDGHLIDTNSFCQCNGYPALYQEFVKYYEGQNSPQITTKKEWEYEKYGNVEKYTNFGDLATSSDDLIAEITYLNNPQNYLVGIETSIVVKNNAGNVIRKREAIINQNIGKVTKIKNYNGSVISETDISYDAYGNIDTLKLPKNHQNQRMFYKYTYDNAVHSYPVTIKDAYGYSSSSTYDYKFGKPLTVTDINGNITTYTYDWRGRITKIKSPNETDYTLKFSYWLNANTNTFPATTLWAKTEHYDADYPTNSLVTVLFADASGKILQTKKDIEENGTEKRQISGKIIYDAYGRVIKQYYPTTENINNQELAISTLIDNVLPTESIYDILDRKVRIKYPDQTETNTNYSISHDYAGTKRFKTTKTDALQNSIISYSDPRNLQTQVHTVLGDTKFEYNAMGELTKTTDPEGLETTSTYDNFGQQISRISPDAGTTTYSYDNVGNLTQKNQNGNIANYIYNYRQNTEIQYPANLENNVKFIYGNNTATNNCKGRIYQIEDINGWKQHEYDKLGNVSKQTKLVVLPNEDNSYNFTISYTYDSWGRTKTITYPDNEIVTYSYNLGGLLKKVSGRKNTNCIAIPPDQNDPGTHSLGKSVNETYNYVDSIYYNKYEKKSQIFFGNNTKTTYLYNNMQRLSNMQTLSGTTAFQTVDYQYDNVGNITQIHNNADTISNGLGGRYTNSYTYDNAYRLAQGINSQQISGVYKNATSLYTYTDNGKITKSKTTIGSGKTAQLSGFENYLYSATNNKLIQNSIPQGTQSLYGSRKIFGYIWDANGNLKQIQNKKEVVVTGLIGQPCPCMNCPCPPPIIIYNLDTVLVSTRDLFWDEENRLQAVKDDDYYSYYFYDYAGERSFKTSGIVQTGTTNGLSYKRATFNQQTLYLFPEVTVTNQSYTKHIFAGSDRICSKIGKGRYCPQANLPTISKTTTEISNKKTAQRNLMNKVYPNICFPNPPAQCVVSSSTIPKNVLKNKLDSITLAATGTESTLYFYHSDHLGSSSWITNKTAQAIQNITYLPYGKEFINQRSTTYEAIYKFSGKERDIETGYGYFGARYYSSELGIWISTDPMAGKYPSLTPYNYCADNPIMLQDPDGKKIETTDKQSQSNIRNTLTKQEAKYVKFDKNGMLNNKTLNKSKSTSENMTALKTLANSKTTYSFQVSEAGHDGEKFYDNSATGGNYYRGVTEIPNAQSNPSPDDKVHIMVGSVLSEEQQVMTTAHEAFGHGLFFEFKQQGQDVEPNHTYKTEGTMEWDEVIQMNAPVIFQVPTNTKLENQINSVVNQAKINYDSRKK